MPHTSSSEYTHKEPCPNCGSKDNLARYSDGHGWCFGCHYYEPGDGSSKHKETNPMAKSLIEGEVKALKKRSIREATCSKWNYEVGDYNGTPVQIANYKNDDGVVIGQKLRFPNKDFMWLGNAKNPGLWGKHLWRDGGKMVTVVEGEVDCLSVSQLFDDKWPVCSVPSGAAGASKSIKKDLQWLEKFDTVVFFFDQDEAGRKAAKECAMLLTPGKAKIVSNLPGKDANECLVKGKGDEVVNAIWAAKTFRPDGVVAGEDLWDSIITESKTQSVEFPWEGLNSKLFGLRQGELLTLTSGTGIGKSSVCRELAYYLQAAGHHIGYIALEESCKRSAEGIMACYLNCPPHLWEQNEITVEQKREAFEHSSGSGRVVFFDHWGSQDPDNLIHQIQYMAKSMGCTHIILDHLSIVVSGLGDGDERRMIDNTMTRLRSLVEETGIALILVSHLRRPEGRGHEEGAQTSLSQLRGSHAIAQLSDGVIGMERNQQDDMTANILTLRVLKNRYSGDTGLACQLEYNKETGRLQEWTGPETQGD